MSISAQRLGFILVLISAFAFASKTILAKLCYQYGADPITVLAIRMAFAGAFFGGVLALNLISGNWTLKFTRRQWLWAVILGLCGYYVSSFLDFSGLVYVDAYLGRMILFLYPTLVVVINSFINRSPVSSATWLALGLCYGGIILMMVPNLGAESNNIWLGSALIFMSALVFALYLVGVDRLLKSIDPARFTSLMMSISCLGVLTHFFITRDISSLSSVPRPVFIYGFIMGLFSTVLPIYTLTMGISRIGASKAAMISMMGPVLTTVMGIVVLDERLTPIQIAGMALVMAGVWKVGRK